MLRRVATSVALTAVLVLGAGASASAHHAEADRTLNGNVKTCKNLDEVDSYWEKSADVPHKITHSWWTVSFSQDNKRLSVTLSNAAKNANAVLAVLVKGGSKTNLFVGEPGQDLLDLFAPVNASGDHATISNYTICKVKRTPTPEPTDKPTPEPTDEPTPEPTDKPTPEPTDEPTPEPTETPTPEPEETPEPGETPVPVPTEVPAGSGSSGGPGAIVGLLAAATVALTGMSVVVRRRFLHES